MGLHNAKYLSLMAALGSIGAAVRIPFAMIPSVQPTTFIVIITGWVLGPAIGLSVGVLSALVSNLFLGQGPWTPFQMLAWGLAGLLSGFLGKGFPYPNIFLLSIYGGLWGYLYGWIMNLWFWITMIYPHTLQTFIASNLTSFWFDSLHAIGNIFFIWLGARMMISILERFKLKFNIYVD